ncbi:MAG: sensor histidine kinase [Gemmatimonas sp.]|nr:ATP-binding protein [Gemmatimonadaceae bacterium]
MTAAESELRRETPITTRTLHRERVKVSQNVAAAIAQELRNPVFAIASAAQLLRYRITDDPLVDKNIGRILREADRLNGLITSLIDYGRPAPVRLAPADPDDVWDGVIESLRGALESKALLMHHTPAQPRASCNLDTEQLAQACAEALANAIDAAPEGSDLTITSTTSDDGAWRAQLHNEGAPIPADALLRVFELLFTTKPGHAGVGLAVAHRIVSEHGGTIALDSPGGGGATLTLTLPGARPL